MKYIRTKHGTIDEVIGETELHWVVKDISGIKGALLHKSFVVKQANTIEELCDEFVFMTKKYRYFCKKDPNRNTYYCVCRIFDLDKNKDIFKKYHIYGAIWTEWGLKYIAKMNKDGVLELI